MSVSHLTDVVRDSGSRIETWVGGCIRVKRKMLGGLSTDIYRDLDI